MRTCEKCVKNEATNVISGVNPPDGGRSIGRAWFLCRTCETEYKRVYEDTIQRVPCPTKPDMSEQEQRLAAQKWRDEVNRQLSDWVLGKQAHE